ncbi:Gfo/Idh/MocA family oxidoreductase [Arthrobacter gengyunqii]|uniref:Gfo/Idh/MocA family oxidoreductase n=1 Tax=Arthrobacter gengyunqii TaxID=2886940 RepID=A0A9X1S5L3_9MICC|nr:Gfo/Idh/MocA family oxidoreductase [Arthrobacter gengyunqii]MCC3269530.1 Gfo/Idh/MocA family oxidoreductase [Arthrobacter gengyunqii]UOY97003.1 Gfo/Idh/MocA family oxidoreductase [Arthrobacter gengyunqii]
MDSPYIPTPPCVFQGAPSPVSKTGRTLRWGVVATGNISAKVSEDIARLEDAVLHAVSSRGPDSAEEFADRFGFTRSYFDDDRGKGYHHLIEDPEVDVVYVGAPHAQHYEISRAALLAGKHVLCEKSLTINARETEDLMALASSRGLFLMEAVWTRFLPCINRIWEILASGELGEVRWVQADLGFPSPPDPASRLWNPEAGGGALLDLSVYPLTLAVGSLGFPDAVTAVGAVNGDGIDTQNALLLSYRSGATAQLSSSLVAACTRTGTIAGSKGWLRTGAPLHNPVELTIQPHLGERRVERFRQVGNGYTYELREVTRCIQSGLLESPTMSWEHSLATMRLFDEARRQMGVRYRNDVPARTV